MRCIVGLTKGITSALMLDVSEYCYCSSCTCRRRTSHVHSYLSKKENIVTWTFMKMSGLPNCISLFRISFFSPFISLRSVYFFFFLFQKDIQFDFCCFKCALDTSDFAEGTAVMNVLNQSEWTGSGSFLTRFHPMAEVNGWGAYFLSNHWQVCKIFPLQLWADEAKYTFY